MLHCTMRLQVPCQLGSRPVSSGLVSSLPDLEHEILDLESSPEILESGIWIRDSESLTEGTMARAGISVLSRSWEDSNHGS